MAVERRTGTRRGRSSEGYHGSHYIEGNTVRKPLPDPYRQGDETSQERRRRLALQEQQRRRHEEEQRRRQEEEKRRQEEKKLRNRAIARENQEKISKVDISYAAFLGLALALTLLTCIYYLSLQSQLSTLDSNISTLEEELADLTDDNNEAQKRLNNAVDLEEIYQTAVESLGMAYPTKDQIIYYDSGSNDYIRQYQAIPQSD